MFVPLTQCQPGAIHSDRQGRAWYGSPEMVDPHTGMIREATLTLRTSPRPGDTHWVDGNAITIPPAGLPPQWPTIDELQTLDSLVGKK